jgi:hypothetical protein
MSVRVLGVRGLSVALLVALGALGGGLLAGTSASAAVVHRLLPPEEGFGSFSHPTGVAVDQASGNVLIADGGGAEVVHVFGPEGGAPLGGSPAELTGLHAPFAFGGEPVGIAVDNSCYYRGLSGAACTTFDPSNGAVYVPNVNGDGDVVEEFRLNGGKYEYVCQFTGYGGLSGSACEAEPARSPATHFREPLGVAVDSDGDVYIADYESKAVYEFNAKGEEVRGPVTGPFGHPQYLALDAAGDLFVESYGAEGSVFELKRDGTGGFEPAVEIANEASSIAVEPVHDLLYVGIRSAIHEYALGGAKPVLVSVFSSIFLNDGTRGLAVSSASGDVYASNVTSDLAFIFSGPLEIPDTRTGGVTKDNPSGATLTGEVNPNGTKLTTCEFEYGAEASYGKVVGCSVVPGAVQGFVVVSAPVGGGEPYTPYHYRLVTANENGVTEGEDQTFYTLTTPPSVTDKPAFALGVSQLSATLEGTVDPIGAPTTYHFEYGTTSAYGSSSPFPEGYVASDRVDHTVTQTIVGLSPGTTYHFALVANSPGGTSTGPDETFTTPPVPASTVTTGGASEVALDAATLTGAIDPQGWETGYYFEYGPTPAYGSRWPSLDVTLGGLTGSQTIVTFLQNLQPGTTYHYRLVAVNAGGAGYGADQTFTTLEYPASMIQEAPVLRAPLGTNPKAGQRATSPGKRKPKKKKQQQKQKRRPAGRRRRTGAKGKSRKGGAKRK